MNINCLVGAKFVYHECALVWIVTDLDSYCRGSLTQWIRYRAWRSLTKDITNILYSSKESLLFEYNK
jgi:hypothetical protein